jgi:DNA-binding IclR family transcriptional regulator
VSSSSSLPCDTYDELMVQPAPAVRHAARIVQLLADHPRSEFTLSEIARTVVLNKTSCLSILGALVESGSVVKHQATLRYAIGPAHLGLGAAASQRYDFLEVARVELDRLCEPEGLYWNVGTLSGTEMIVLAASDPRPISLGFGPGNRFSLTPPFGFIYVSWSAPEVVEAWLKQAVPDGDPAQLANYREAIQMTRQRGYSVGIRSAKQARLLSHLDDLRRHPDQPELIDRVDDLLGDLELGEFVLSEIEPDRLYEVSFLSVPILDDLGSVVSAATVGGYPRALSGGQLEGRCTALAFVARRIASALHQGDVRPPGLSPGTAVGYA